jgi:hypothetical protein
MVYHLAQINIGRIVDVIGSETMSGFTNALAEINALAEATPGFVWRLQTSEGDATAIHVYDDHMILINMSVWESVDALFGYVYASDHTDFLRQRAQWFHRMNAPIMALWWIPEGHIPTPEEGKAKLAHLAEHGATPLAFTFKQRFTIEDYLALVEQPG